MHLVVVAIAAVLAGGSLHGQPARPDPEALPFAPRQTVCYRTPAPLTIDGAIDEPAWQAAAWSEPFVDIDGRRPVRLATRMKMLWDDEYFYVAADLEEPDVWATLTRRDSVIFHDNDIELFIDPDGDSHGYYELEVNALATVWDLLLVRPYRDGGPAIHAWDIAGLRVAVDVRGTINRPGDRDGGWSVEMALPWAILREAAPDRRAPRDGEQWRVNLSRVQWTLDEVDGTYRKRIDAATGKPLAEDNWVWSPQGAIDMHMPERWGYIQFTDVPAGSRAVAFVEDPYASDLAALSAGNIQVDGLQFRPTLTATDSLYEISAAGFDGSTIHIGNDGRTWATPR